MTLQKRKPAALLPRGILIVLAGLVGLLLIITTYAKYGAPLGGSPAPAAAAAGGQANREGVEAELITIEPHGFEPARDDPTAGTLRAPG
ncbi:MAG TPA: hypothetical protein VJ023_18595 [Pyrinomonadaceae bacterium]|nr:hypothetical protein [Pyrinomonadaceae bacterium]